MHLTECDGCDTYVPTSEVEEVEKTGIWMDYCPDCYEEHQSRGLTAKIGETIHMVFVMILFVLAVMVALVIAAGILEAMV